MGEMFKLVLQWDMFTMSCNGRYLIALLRPLFCCTDAVHRAPDAVYQTPRLCTVAGALTLNLAALMHLTAVVLFSVHRAPASVQLSPSYAPGALAFTLH